MAKHSTLYLHEDTQRLFEMCEAVGIIKSRSSWVKTQLEAFAMEHGIAEAFDQAIQRDEEALIRKKALKREVVKVEIDRELTWTKMVKQFCNRREMTRKHDKDWLITRKAEVRIVRPGKTLDEVLDELVQERESL